MHAVLLTHDRYRRSYRTVELMRQLENLGVHVTFLVPEHTMVFVHGNQITFHRHGDPLDRPDVVINGLYLAHGRGLEIIESYEALGVPVVNSSESWRRARSKPFSSVLFGRAGLPHPKTAFTRGRSAEEMDLWSTDLGWPVIGKPWRGSIGVGVTRLTGPVQGERWVRRQARQRQPIYLQRQVEHPGRDVRVSVVGDEAIGAVYRYVNPGMWKTGSVSRAHTARCEMTPQLAHLAVAASTCLRLDVACVDLLESAYGYEILEVNVWPHYQYVERQVGISSYSTPYRHTDLAPRLATCFRTRGTIRVCPARRLVVRIQTCYRGAPRGPGWIRCG